jgi:hypothetical protein
MENQEEKPLTRRGKTGLPSKIPRDSVPSVVNSLVFIDQLNSYKFYFYAFTLVKVCASVLRQNKIQVKKSARPMPDEAARIKTFYKQVSLADTIGLATAFCTGGVFVTSDHHELDAVDRSASVRFLWIR